ncbi:AzlC family ABC transporter permease [Dictyobacter aurantiacus]|uniref:Branched-chain amino acid ABC transporter permease n=1 Tax=Dictyobacter aurantiacus TaxID=1936993 RepID=A0A401ZP40_9CHLR|nr:AzlC family ABC transporter permease [Dictyobacter aurantiacus]GCE08678.1 branched-chain amino acid ABC transporter permease [Dictyobacter aurantiacus]
MKASHFEFLHGVRDELPILLGVVPFGMIYGVSAISAGIPASIAQAMSCIVFAGSAQFVIAQLIAAGVPALVVILTAFIVNIRHVLYSASVSPYTRRLHVLWKWLLAYLLTDEAYAVTILHYQKPGEDGRKHFYFLGAGLALWTTWQLSTAAGIFLGGHIPASWSLDFTSTLTFIALVVPALKDRVSTASALAAALTALLVIALPLKLGIAVAALVGIAVGLIMELKGRTSL